MYIFLHINVHIFPRNDCFLPQRKETAVYACYGASPKRDSEAFLSAGRISIFGANGVGEVQSLKANIRYLIAALSAMLLGYGSRRYADGLPAFVAVHMGDALWAGMVYFGIRMLGASVSLKRSALLSFLFCFGIEFSQLYQAEWINAIRGTTIGALVLGSGYLTVDLVRYSAGIGVAMLLDRFLLHKRKT